MQRTEVVVFRSPAEAFYWDNPEYILYIFGGAILIIAGFVIYGKIQDMRNRRKYGKYGRW